MFSRPAHAGSRVRATGYGTRGNRTERGLVTPTLSATESYTYDIASNRLVSTLATSGGAPIQSRTLAHGDSGNRSADAAAGTVANVDYAMAYDASDRLVSVSNGGVTRGAYLHNAMGQRVAKTVGPVTTHFLYDLSGRLIAEADGATGAATAEYIAFEGMWLAFIATGNVYSIHVDHLGTPQMLTDGAGLIAWSATYAPFGLVLEETGITGFNLRFPGQYHDRETEYYYNYYRTYDPTSGRYLESDPIGLGGGWNTYAYVGGNPVSFFDEDGLKRVVTKVIYTTMVRTVDLARPITVRRKKMDFYRGDVFAGCSLVETKPIAGTEWKEMFQGTGMNAAPRIRWYWRVYGIMYVYKFKPLPVPVSYCPAQSESDGDAATDWILCRTKNEGLDSTTGWVDAGYGDIFFPPDSPFPGIGR